jgi:hypothetical protein
MGLNNPKMILMLMMMMKNTDMEMNTMTMMKNNLNIWRRHLLVVLEVHLEGGVVNNNQHLVM